jgi:twitching motility two-component system response regulator PilH
MRSVLIVEDDSDARRLFRVALSLAGFAVREAGDGLDALRSLDADPPDLVVLDLGLPLVTGQTVQAELAARAHTRHIPIVVVTGSPESLGDAQVACLLRKPVSPDDLVETVQKCLASAGGSTTG